MKFFIIFYLFTCTLVLKAEEGEFSSFIDAADQCLKEATTPCALINQTMNILLSPPTGLEDSRSIYIQLAEKIDSFLKTFSGKEQYVVALNQAKTRLNRLASVLSSIKDCDIGNNKRANNILDGLLLNIAHADLENTAYYTTDGKYVEPVLAPENNYSILANVLAKRDLISKSDSANDDSAQFSQSIAGNILEIAIINYTDIEYRTNPKANLLTIKNEIKEKICTVYTIGSIAFVSPCDAAFDRQIEKIIISKITSLRKANVYRYGNNERAIIFDVINKIIEEANREFSAVRGKIELNLIEGVTHFEYDQRSYDRAFGNFLRYTQQGVGQLLASNIIIRDTIMQFRPIARGTEHFTHRNFQDFFSYEDPSVVYKINNLRLKSEQYSKEIINLERQMRINRNNPEKLSDLEDEYKELKEKREREIPHSISSNLIPYGQSPIPLLDSRSRFIVRYGGENNDNKVRIINRAISQGKTAQLEIIRKAVHEYSNPLNIHKSIIDRPILVAKRVLNDPGNFNYVCPAVTKAANYMKRKDIEFAILEAANIGLGVLSLITAFVPSPDDAAFLVGQRLMTRQIRKALIKRFLKRQAQKGIDYATAVGKIEAFSIGTGVLSAGAFFSNRWIAEAKRDMMTIESAVRAGDVDHDILQRYRKLQNRKLRVGIEMILELGGGAA